MIDYTALKKEITNDPLELGYAPFVSAGNDQAIAGLLNKATGPDAGQVYASAMSRDDFMLAFIPALITLPNLSATIQSKWDRILGVIRAADTINISNSSIQALLGEAVSDGVLTSEQTSIIGQRTGSRAEVLFGAGTTLGIDSDNDSAFINETVIAYCQQHKLEFTRSRAYQKNDQAWIEQKNGAIVRRFVGYERFAGLVAGQCLAQLFQAVRLFVNHFQPSFKLRSKTRVGAKVKKVYHKPATPCERLLAHAAVAEEVRQKLRSERDRLDPLELLQRIRESQSALAALGSGDLGSGPKRESLDQFLATLPELWRAGEARPTHRQGDTQPRAWRTRKDPFDGVWAEILLWLQGDPDATAKSLLECLHQDYPGRFPDGQLRTLQRRIREWRRVMARELVYTGLESKAVGEKPRDGAEAGA
jgi:hypothetical protein